MIILVLFSCGRPEMEQCSVAHLRVWSLGLYSNSVNTERDVVRNILLSKSVAVLSVLFTCRDQQRSFWNALFIQRFTKSQFQQKKKKNKSLVQEVKIHISFHLQLTGNELIHSYSQSYICLLSETFPFHESFMLFFSTPMGKQNKKTKLHLISFGCGNSLSYRKPA